MGRRQRSTSRSFSLMQRWVMASQKVPLGQSSVETRQLSGPLGATQAVSVGKRPKTARKKTARHDVRPPPAGAVRQEAASGTHLRTLPHNTGAAVGRRAKSTADDLTAAGGLAMPPRHVVSCFPPTRRLATRSPATPDASLCWKASMAPAPQPSASALRAAAQPGL